MTVSRITRLALGAALVAALLGFVPADAARRGRASRAGDREEVLEAGVFLVATHRLIDPRFSRSVILLTRYGPQGAMGVIVNRPTEHRLSDLLPEIEALEGRGDRLFFGGPVSVNAIVLLLESAKEVELEHTERVFDDVYLSGNPEAFALIAGRKKENPAIRGYAGYAGWGPGQLEAEIARKDWSIVRADASTIFRKEPSTLWKELSPEPEPGRELRAAL
jgi:putative transcriptional regulator